MAKQTPPLHIFKPGTHTDMSGTPRSFTPALLTQIAAAYDPARHEAPLVVGHPRHDLPAYGWVQSLTYSDGEDGNPAGLYALPAQVNADFADMVAAGAFKKISAAFYPADAPGNPTPGQVALRHVGFLGAQPPAIKGLLPPKVMVNFADGDADGLMVFGEDSASTTETTDTAADVIDPPTPTTVITPGEPTVTEQEAAALKAHNEALAAELATLKAQAEGQRIATIHAANLAFCESLVTSAKLLPVAKDVPLIAPMLPLRSFVTRARLVPDTWNNSSPFDPTAFMFVPSHVQVAGVCAMMSPVNAAGQLPDPPSDYRMLSTVLPPK